MSKTQTQTQNAPFVDYYELFQCSPDTTLDSIEKLFRNLVKQYDREGDNADDMTKLSELVGAFDVLRDKSRRDSYDKEYQRRKSAKVEVATNSEATFKDNGMGDTHERLKLLNILSERRRNNGKNPGIPASTLASTSKLSEIAIDFHIWYFLQKGWVQREDSGVLSITAQGIDRIDEINISLNGNARPRI